MNKPIKNKARKQKVRQNENLLMFLLPFVLLFSALLLASLVSVFIDLEKKLNFPVITVIFSFCTFLSAFKKREKGLVAGIIYNLPSVIIILLLSLILNGFSVDLNILLSFVTMLISSALGGVIGVNRKQKAKRGMR